mgnify:FL=1
MENYSNNPEHLSDEDPEKDLDYMRQDKGGVVTSHNGVGDKLLSGNNELYNSMKGDWSRKALNKSGNIEVTTGREGNNFYIRREQKNIEAIKQGVREYRQLAEAGFPDPLAPVMPDGKLGYKWMELPKAISFDIAETYFGGMPWEAIKRDKTLKAQFYQVVQTEYPAFICYPGGKLPIPVDVPYPTRVGQERFFKGH